MIKAIFVLSIFIFSFVQSTYEHNNKKYIIFGAGPGGLYASWKILQQNPEAKVLLLEKRYDPNMYALNEEQAWLKRKQVIQCHSQYFVDEESGFDKSFCDKKCENCNVNPLPDTEFGRQTIFEKLDYFSLRNIQSTLYEKLTTTKGIEERFLFKAGDIKSINQGDNEVELTAENVDISSWSADEGAITMVDATGTGSYIMGKLVGYELPEPNRFGAAVKFTMNDHAIEHDAKNKINRMFHDCHEGTVFKGDSSYHCFDHFNALWKYLETTKNKNHKEFYNEMDIMFRQHMVLGIPIPKIVAKMEEFDLFKTDLAIKFAWRLLENVINMDGIDPENPKYHEKIMELLQDHRYKELGKVNMLYIRNRDENWLNHNLIEVTVKFNEKTFFNVQTIAIGDALTWTDWATGLGINRAFKSVEEIFVNRVEPNEYLESLKHTYAAQDCDHRGLLADLGRAWVLPKKVIISEEFNHIIMKNLYDVHFGQLSESLGKKKTYEIFNNVMNDLEKRQSIPYLQSHGHHLRYFDVAISIFQSNLEKQLSQDSLVSSNQSSTDDFVTEEEEEDSQTLSVTDDTDDNSSTDLDMSPTKTNAPGGMNGMRPSKVEYSHKI